MGTDEDGFDAALKRSVAPWLDAVEKVDPLSLALWGAMLPAVVATDDLLQAGSVFGLDVRERLTVQLEGAMRRSPLGHGKEYRPPAMNRDAFINEYLDGSRFLFGNYLDSEFTVKKAAVRKYREGILPTRAAELHSASLIGKAVSDTIEATGPERFLLLSPSHYAHGSLQNMRHDAAHALARTEAPMRAYAKEVLRLVTLERLGGGAKRGACTCPAKGGLLPDTPGDHRVDCPHWAP